MNILMHWQKREQCYRYGQGARTQLHQYNNRRTAIDSYLNQIILQHSSTAGVQLNIFCSSLVTCLILTIALLLVLDALQQLRYPVTLN